MEEKQRIIQEYVPGKQVTLAHLIAHPQVSVYKKLGISEEYKDALGILTITPSEAAIIAADVATKEAAVENWVCRQIQRLFSSRRRCVQCRSGVKRRCKNADRSYGLLSSNGDALLRRQK